MIPLVNSLEEAITHVKDPAVREELEYQYDKLNRNYQEAVSHELELESDLADYDELQHDYEKLVEMKDQYEEDADVLEAIKTQLSCYSGTTISTSRAEDILNFILEEIGQEKVRVSNFSDPLKKEIMPF